MGTLPAFQCAINRVFEKDVHDETTVDALSIIITFPPLIRPNWKLFPPRLGICGSRKKFTTQETTKYKTAKNRSDANPDCSSIVFPFLRLCVGVV